MLSLSLCLQSFYFLLTLDSYGVLAFHSFFQPIFLFRKLPYPSIHIYTRYMPNIYPYYILDICIYIHFVCVYKHVSKHYQEFPYSLSHPVKDIQIKGKNAILCTPVYVNILISLWFEGRVDGILSFFSGTEYLSPIY